jgi:glycosyltransferase involved in cell wall biosynthesis
VLAAAAPAIVAQFPQTHFLLIGERTSQKEESILFERKIQQEFDQAGLANRLHWCGNREDVCELLGEIDLLVHPANQEPFGRVLLEASAAGIPIVATDVGGTAEIVIDRVTGRLVPPRNPAAIAEAILQLLADANAAQRLGDQARDRALNHFSIAIAAQHLGNFWQEVLAVPTPTPDLA